MNVHPNILLAILKKDLRCLLPMISVVVLILIFEAIITTVDPDFTSGMWGLVKLYFPYVSMAACAMLIVAVFQQDPSESVEHDWLTRPIAKLDLLFAKLAFLCLTILVPMMLAHLVANLMNGRSLWESVLQATVFENSWTILVIPFLMAIAVLSRSFMQALGTLLVSLVVLVSLHLLPRSSRQVQKQ